MTVKTFSELFPHSSEQFRQLIKVEPHESLGGKNTWRGRKAVGELFGREIALFLFQTPVYIIFNLILLIGKSCQMIWQTMLLCRPSKMNVLRLRTVSLSAADYAFLLPILPIFRLAIIGKLAIASVFPKIYFKKPSEVSLYQQELYYRKCIRKSFESLLGQQELTLEHRTVLHHFSKGIALIGSRLIDIVERRNFYREIDRYLCLLKQSSSDELLKAFDRDLKLWASKAKLDLSSFSFSIPENRLG